MSLLRLQIPPTSSSFRPEWTSRPFDFRTPPPPTHESFSPISSDEDTLERRRRRRSYDDGFHSNRDTPNLMRDLSSVMNRTTQEAGTHEQGKAGQDDPIVRSGDESTLTREVYSAQKRPTQEPSTKESRKRKHDHNGVRDVEHATSSRGLNPSQKTPSQDAASPGQNARPGTAQSPSALDMFATVATSPDLRAVGFDQGHHSVNGWPKPGHSQHSKRSRSEAIDARKTMKAKSRPVTSHNPPDHSNHRRSGSEIEDDAMLLLGFAQGAAQHQQQPKAASHPLSPAQHAHHHIPKPSKQYHASSEPFTQGKQPHVESLEQQISRGVRDHDHLHERMQSPKDETSARGAGRESYRDESHQATQHEPLWTSVGSATSTSVIPGETGRKSQGLPKRDSEEAMYKDGAWVRSEADHAPPPNGILSQGSFEPPQPDHPPRPLFDNTFRNRARTLSGSKLPNPIMSPRRIDHHDQMHPSHPPEPPDGQHEDDTPAHLNPLRFQDAAPIDEHAMDTKDDIPLNICSICQSQSANTGDQDQWIGCNGCKKWYHMACVGIKNEREVRDIDKFYCPACENLGHRTTRVRKSGRAHASLDYAGLNEGEIRTATDTVDHHYIRAFRDGTIALTPESFPRMRPELVTAEFFERSGTMSEPVLIPADWNPRPEPPAKQIDSDLPMMDADADANIHDNFNEQYDYDCVPDDGQDKLDMVMPHGLTVRAVAELVGPETKVEVIDVKSQEGGEGQWNMRKWADYYEASGEKPVRNVISLEVSQTKLGRLVRRPKIVRDLDLQDAVWPQDELAKGAYPQVQFYCLMSVQDCYTDFHIDFGGSSVFYHILKGSKTFFFIPPKKQHLKAYADWCKSSNQSATFLGDITKECYRVDLVEGDTMLIPSGWIHSVWTPTNSLVIGGNFLTRMHYGMQIAINDIEKATGVGRRFRYPSFQKVLWYAVIQYLQEDPVPSEVAETLYAGLPFERQTAAYDDFDLRASTIADDPAYYNARYYSKGEIEGLSDLMRFVHRTVMISFGKVQGISKTTQEAVVRSLPKGYGDHLDLLKTFALWCAWKRGNEALEVWAYPDVPASAIDPVLVEKRSSSAAPKRAEVVSERRSARAAKEKEAIKEREVIKEREEKPSRFQDVDSPVKGMTNSTPKSAPGPRRIACEACRKRRIRCKHKDSDESYSTGPVQRFGIKPMSNASPEPPSLDQLPMMSPWAPVAVMSVPQQVEPLPPTTQSPTQQQAAISSKVKACDECRKSKRRCVHDEFGNIDPIKASQTPVPRAYSATKRARTDNDGDQEIFKRVKLDDVDSQDSSLNHYAPAIGDENATLADILAQHNQSQASEREPQQMGTIAGHLLDPSLIDMTSTAVEALKEASCNGQSTSAAKTEDRHQKQEVFPDEPLSDMTAQQSNGTVQSVTPGEEHGVHNEPSADAQAVQPSAMEEEEIQAEEAQDLAKSDSRSRTPSLRVQTNSSDSNNGASGSVHSSPLTELDPSSPVTSTKDLEHHVKESRVNGVVKADPEPVSRSRSRSRATSTKIAATFATPRSKRNTTTTSDNGTSASAKTASDTKSKSATPAYASAKRNRSISVKASPINANGSPMVENEEDEASMRLIRQLMEQERGLRRRS